MLVYAEKEEMAKNPLAHTFNCAQRAHGSESRCCPQFYLFTLVGPTYSTAFVLCVDTLELMPQMLFGAAVSGLLYPVASAASLGVWVLGRGLL